MMGIPESDYDSSSSTAPTSSSAAPTPSTCARTGTSPRAARPPARSSPQLVTTWPASAREHPTDDLISALVTANVDGEQLTARSSASFFILLVVAGNETTRNAIATA